MRTLTYLSVSSVAALGLLFMTACSNTSTTSAAKPSNSDIERNVKAQLASNPDLQAANLDVDANADKNEIKLSGTVPTESLRTQAVQMAKAAQPGAVVTDKIDVKPKELTRSDYTEEMARSERERSTGDKIGTSLDDAWIHSKITTKLIGNSNTPERKINVDVNNGAVTLRGTVDSATEKAEAERVAKETDGVKRVSNMLKVKAG